MALRILNHSTTSSAKEPILLWRRAMGPKEKRFYYKGISKLRVWGAHSETGPQSTLWFYSEYILKNKICLFSNYFTHSLSHTQKKSSFSCQFPVFLSAEWLREHHFLCGAVLQKACTLRVGYFDFDYTEEIDSGRGKICLQVTTPNSCSSLIKVGWMYILFPPSTSPLSLKVSEKVGHSMPVFYLLCCDLHLPMLFVSGSVTFLEPKHTKEPINSTSYYEQIVVSPKSYTEALESILSWNGVQRRDL